MDARQKTVTAALGMAAPEGDKCLAEALIEGAEVHGPQEGAVVALHLAAKAGHPEVAGALLKAGAEVNAVDDQGWTPIGRATQVGHTELARFLAEHGGVE
jgi:ankyrin repeat protein